MWKTNGLNTIPVKEMCKNIFVYIRVRNYHLSSCTHIEQKLCIHKNCLQKFRPSPTLKFKCMHWAYIPYNIPHIELSHESHTVRHVLLFFMYNYLKCIYKGGLFVFQPEHDNELRDATQNSFSSILLESYLLRAFSRWR